MTPMNLEVIHKQHEALLSDNQEIDGDRIASVTAFLETLAQAGAVIDRPEQRAHLRALIRYWSSFIFDQTGTSPYIRLQPFDTSQFRQVCHQCGANVLPGKAFCGNCGAA